VKMGNMGRRGDGMMKYWSAEVNLYFQLIPQLSRHYERSVESGLDLCIGLSRFFVILFLRMTVWGKRIGLKRSFVASVSASLRRTSRFPQDDNMGWAE